MEAISPTCDYNHHGWKVTIFEPYKIFADPHIDASNCNSAKVYETLHVLYSFE